MLKGLKKKTHYHLFTIAGFMILCFFALIMFISAVHADSYNPSIADKKFLNLLFINNTDLLPAAFLNDSSTFEKIRSVLEKGNNLILKNYTDRLISEADSILSEKPVSVTDKEQIPPSGNKHDFYSLAAYEWPNPNTPNGLPYVSRDGKINPEIFSISDKKSLDKMANMVKILSYANYFTGKPIYAAKAEEFLRTWFLNEETYMNPNLNYAEIARGKNELNPGGIMEGYPFSSLTKSIELLRQSPNWDKKLDNGLDKWFSNYLNWLLFSESGKVEVQKMNNHGTYYLVQVSNVALFLNKTALAKEILTSTMQEISSSALSDLPKLIAVKIAPDGRQPFELERANSLSYSMINLIGLFELATIGQSVGLNMWNYNNHGVSLQEALDFILPYTSDKNSWPYIQISHVKKQHVAELTCKGILNFGDDLYKDYYATIETKNLDFDIEYPLCDLIMEISHPKYSN